MLIAQREVVLPELGGALSEPSNSPGAHLSLGAWMGVLTVSEIGEMLKVDLADAVAPRPAVGNLEQFERRAGRA
jgi:hypothetical protein